MTWVPHVLWITFFFSSELLHSSNLGHLLGLKPMNSFDLLSDIKAAGTFSTLQSLNFTSHPFYCLIEALLYSLYGQWKVLRILGLGNSSSPSSSHPCGPELLLNNSQYPLSLVILAKTAESCRSVTLAGSQPTPYYLFWEFNLSSHQDWSRLYS